MHNLDQKIKLISAYQCVQSHQTMNTVYNQQLYHFKKIERDICSHHAFHQDLVQFLTESMQSNNEIILCIDMNEYVFDRKL